MLIRVPIADLKFCLGIAFSATLGNKNRPILNNVLLTIDQQFAMEGHPAKFSGKLSAHDGDITVSCRLNHLTVEGMMTGQQLQILLPPVVQSIINELPTMQSVEILVQEDDRQHIILIGGMGRFRLQTADPDEFPPVAASSGFAADFSVDGTLLQRAIKRVIPACDAQATKYALGSVLLDWHAMDNTVALVATDARRLHMNTLPVTVETPDDNGDTLNRWKSVLLPIAAANVLAKIAKDSPTVKLRADSSTLQAEGLGLLVECRLMAGRFPKYRGILPKTAQVIELETGLFLRSLRAAAATVDREEDAATLTFANNADGGNVHIAIDSSEGDASVDCPLPHPVEDFQTTLRAKYVASALSAMAADEPVELHTPEESGGAIRLHQQVCQFTAVVMPMEEDAAKEPKK